MVWDRCGPLPFHPIFTYAHLPRKIKGSQRFLDFIRSASPLLLLPDGKATHPTARPYNSAVAR